ncbi:protocadherin Fat 4-like [Glandiceps talaboti]
MQRVRTLEYDYFTIDSSTGDVYVTEVLDREEIARYYLVITAHDAGDPSLTGTGTLEIQVNDLNDNPPVFTQTEYSAKVEEEQDTGVSVITVTATDEDDGTNADINYSLDPDSAQNKFGINYLTGEILTTARLDREEQGLYTLLVIAQDNADDRADRLSSTATVYVVVQDINDHVPEFISAPYSAVIPDSTSAGTFVEAVTAIDNDIGTNAQIRYTKVRGNDMSKFSVDATSGVIQTLSTMNNQNSQYWLEIQAQDQGEGFHTTRANVTINFDAAEDFPTFLPTIVAFDLDEDTPVDTVVTEDISATSPKQGQEGAITYFLSGGNFNETFSIHQMTGHVSLAKSLDYEIIQVFYLWVEARDGSSPALSSFIKLTIDVGDINDNAPRFSESTYYGSVFEEQSAGVSVLTVTAIDQDSGDNGEFSYSLDSDGNINTAFEIDASSGKLETNTRLDRETVAFYTLTVYAIDRGSPPLTGTATVEVNVIDVNDNAPRFDYHPLASVFEHSDVGTFVLRVETTDLDEGMNAVTVYEFLDSPVNEFAIHNLTGIITVADDIDREEQDRHSILLLATDLWRSHSVTTTVQISVRDINDNEPEFNPSEYARDLPEGLPEGSSVTTVYATDDDIEQNGEVYYTMKSWCEYFTVDTNSGDVVLEKEIEYQSPGGGAVDPNIYQCSVFAIDGGIPTLWSDTDVSLTIFDHNEYAPEFEQDSYKARVQEDAGIHDKVVQVIATDDYDEGDNAVVRYEISGGNGTSKFTIESDTGWVLVLQSVLGDAGTIYAIQVRAYDQGYVPKDAFTTVSIPISEINQNPPVFYPTLYSQSVDESVQLGFTVTQVTATDIDRGLNGQVRYSITSGDDNEEFAIGSENGIITVAKPLDYDTEPKEYNLIITANDLGVETMTSSARVEVILRDVNDNPPVFDTDYYSQNIPENSPSGTSVISVTATDKDEGSNAYIEYSIYGGDGQYFFSIFQHNGTIISQGNLNYENEKKSYNLEIRARHPIDISMYDTATVTIHITGVNEYNPEFVKHHYLFTVSEAANDGQVIGKISARDADHGEDGRIIYAFVGGSTNQGFAINDDTGEVYVSYSHGRLNRESSDRSLLLAIAKNRGIIEGFDVDEAEIYVNITDANDPPVFVPDFYEGSVWENATYGTYVLTVTAEDYDLKPADHTFTYNITGGNHNNAFMIARDSGEIHTANVLDREDIPFYNLTVAAIDQGSPSMTGYAEVNIDLLDVNDNGPMFYPEDTIGSVYENKQAYTSVMTLSAYDPDTPSNGPPFTYYLLDSQYSSRFNLISTSGLLTTTVPLNREEISDYYLPVESRDSGVPQMTSTTTIHVIVLDVNDNESQPRTAVIYVNSLDGTFPGGSIGIARPLDPDVDDEFDCTIVDGDTNTFSIQPKCDLNSVLHSGVETYMLNISGHDGIHNTVYSDFQVDYHAFTNNSLDNSVTLKLASQDGDSLDVGTFLKNHYDDFYTSVSNKLSGTETLLIIDMYEVDSKLDLLVAVRQGSQDNHMTRSQLAGFFTTYKAAIERESGVNLAEIDYSPCDLQPCLHNGQCDDHAEIYVTYTISDSDPIIFVAPQSQRAFICTCAQEYYGDICQYEPDMCEDNECKNGATCRKDSQSYICECLPGYTGTKCETDIDECASNPCQHGDCEDQIDSYVCDCDEGYIGVNCQIELDPCNPQPCFNEGECIAQDTGFYCDCSFGERGEFCEFSSFSFTSLSYVQYPDISGPSSIITLQFATTSQNALLVYNHDSTKGSDSEFVALEIIDGQMWFSHNSGAGVTRLSTTQMVSDGQWHEVIARRERTMESKLMIDQCDENIPGDYCRAETTSQGYNQLDLDGEPLHLGGVKSIESITLRPGQVSTSDFVGCMRDVYINGQFYDLTQPLDIMGVEAKCPRDVTLCESSPCQNGGTCVDDWWTYHCECLDGFMGHYCESEMSSFTFGGDSFVKYKIKDSFRREKALEGNLRRKKRATDTQTTSLSFRTRHHNGLLFYSADTDQLFTILEIKEKHVKYTFSSGNLGNASIILDGVDASDGHWQNVTLTKDGYTITLNLNGKNSKSETFSIPPHDFISITVQDLFVGGTENPLSYKGQVIPGLDGCIDTFMLNDEVMPFVGENNMVIAEPYDGGGGGGSAGGCDGSDVCASNPCPDGEVCLDEWESYSCVPIGLCQPDPCQNNGTCVPGKDGNSYTCECVNDYSGDHCEIIPECYEDPCNEDEECISDGSGGHVCSPLVGGGGGGDTNITLIIVFIVLALVVILFVVICLVYVRKRRKRKPEDKTKDQAVVDLDGVGEVNEAFTGENLKSNSPTNSEKARLGILGKQPDIIENEQKKRNINLDADTTITEGEIITPGLQMEEVEHYDLENASSIAPSDIDVTYHYRGYRDGRQQYNRNIHKHRMSPSHFAQARQSPLAPLYTPGARQSPLHHTSRQSPNPLRGQSPHSHLNMFSRTSPIKELSHSRTNSDQSINHSELRSEPGFRSNVSTASEASRRTKSPNGHLPNSRPSSRLKSPLTVGTDLDSEQPVGLSVEEVAMLNSSRPNEHAGSLPSTLEDGFSTSSSDHPRGRRVPFPNQENLLEPPESSTDESNDSFTCSEFEVDREKLKFTEFDPSKMIFSKLAEVNEDDTDLPDTSRIYNYVGIDSGDGSLSTLPMSGDEFPHVAVKPPNGHFSWDYLLNWGPSFENLVGVFKDIALLQDANITMKLEADPNLNLEEYV